MKKLLLGILVISIFSGVLFASEMDDFDVSKQSDTATFKVGSDASGGVLWYTVDRKNKLCFATLQSYGGDNGSNSTLLLIEALQTLLWKKA